MLTRAVLFLLLAGAALAQSPPADDAKAIAARQALIDQANADAKALAEVAKQPPQPAPQAKP